MEEGPSNRHRFQSQAAVLKSTHVPTLPSIEDTTIVPDTSSSFYEALQSWRELNLTVSFTAFADEVEQLAKSMNMLLHNWQQVVDIWKSAVPKAESDALEPLYDLLGKLIYDLRATLLPVYSTLLDSLLLRLNAKLSEKPLQALLNALSSLFKYLLVPSSSTHMLQHTWAKITSIFRDGGDIGRLVAEVWGKIIRRLKSSEREAVLRLMLEETAEFCVAVALVESMKSPNHGHPPSAPGLLRFVVSRLADQPDSDGLRLTLKRCLTALLHHTTPTHFAPLMDSLLDSQDLFSGDSVKAWMAVIRIPLSVRKGGRLQETHLKRLIPLLPTLPFCPELVHLCSASLIASTLPIWASEGKRMLSAIWEMEDKTLALLVSQMLCEAEWKGWNTFGMPPLLLNIERLLSSQPTLTLRLLADMARQGSLQEVTGMTGGRRFLDAVRTWSTEQLPKYASLNEDDICDLSNLLAVLPFLSAPADLTPIIEELVSAEDVKEEWQQTPANRSWLLSACLKYVVESSQVKKIPSHIPAIIEKWSWNAQVMEAVADVVEALKAPLSPPLDKLLVESALLSQSQTLRMAALRLLCSGSFDINTEELATLRVCMTAEEVPLSLEKIRERVMKTERVTGPAGVSWLIAQLKINLRPLWQPAAQTLAKILQSYPDEVWPQVYQQLEAITSRPDSLSEAQPRWPMFAAEETTEEEEERTFRDPSLRNLDLLTANVTTPGHEHELALLKGSQLDPKRLDLFNFEAQLLKSLALAPSVAEQHNRSLVTLLLHLVGSSGEDSDVISTRAVPRKIRSRLAQWLGLFSKFSNPRALYRAPTLHHLYLACLATPEPSLQRLAIDCLLTDSTSPLQSFGDSLKLLLDETKFRDQLASLSLQDLPEDARGEIIQPLLHVLYGIMVRRSSKSRVRRRAILAVLTSCMPSELETLVALMLEPFKGVYITSTPEEFHLGEKTVTATTGQQTGFLGLLGDVLTYLAASLGPYLPALLTTTLVVLLSAQNVIDGLNQGDRMVDEAADGNSDAASDFSVKEGSARASYTVRQLGYKRLSDFCRRCPNLDLTPFMPEIFEKLVSPRLPRFVAENSQSPSALLALFHTWSERQDTLRHLADWDSSLIPTIVDLFTATNVKPAVLIQVLNITEHIVDASASDTSIAETVLSPNAEHILSRLSKAISASSGQAFNDILKRELILLTKLAPRLSDPVHAQDLLVALQPFFRRTGKAIQERAVSDVLRICASIFSLVPPLQDPFSPFFVETYETLGSMFQSLRDRQARLSLVKAFNGLVKPHPEYALVGELAESLNSYLVKRPEEPDFDRRLAAFNKINETQYLIMGHLQWEPVLWNSLYFVQDPEELSIRTNAAFVIRRFIDRLHDQPIPEFMVVFTRIVYPGLRKALHSKSELVKSEVLSLFGTAAEKCDFTVALRELRPLLASGDEEASVLNNFFHIQVHRRTRALRRLAEHVRAGTLGSSVLTDVFIPLLNHYITIGTVDHQIVNEAISTLSTIAAVLPWRTYYGLIQKYLRLCRRKTASERLFVRTILAILEQFSFRLDVTVAPEGDTGLEDDEDDEMTAAPEAKPDTMDDAQPIGQKPPPQEQRIIDVVKGRLLPTLLAYMDDKNATDDEVRIPIAYGIVCVALKLPAEERGPQIDRLLIVLCQVLRSRSHDTRQLARETLYKIATALGADYLPKIIQSLRDALTRGPQLHVLAVSVHGLLVHLTQPTHAPRFTSMDSSAANIAQIACEVLFGQSGRDVANEGFKTTFREVRSSSSKALDTFQLLSRFVTVAHVRDLLSPLRQILQSTGTQKVILLVNDVLHRIASGLNANVHLTPEDILSLCHTLVTQRSKITEEGVTERASQPVAPDFAVQTKRKYAEAAVISTGNLQKFIAFGLELFNTAFRRNRFDLQDEGTTARLEPLVPLIGEALYTDDTQVAIASVKAAAAVLRCPLRSAEKSLPVFIKRLLNLIRKSGSLDSEVAQAALKSLAIILRDCGKAKIVEADLKYLLELIGPELEEPERQSTAFTLLRSIIARQFVAPEIYDLMDRVFDIMVTNQSAQVREACRGIALQFLLDYPQGKGRLRKHMVFLATNLSYEFESGRLSLMELLGAILEKFQPELLREYVDMLFAALVMDLANDDSPKSREMGAALIKKLFGRLDQQQQQTVFTRVHLWINQVEQPELLAVAAQVYGLLMDQPSPVLEKESATILQDLTQVVVRSDKEFKLAEDAEDGMQVDLDWRAPYHSLTSLFKLCRLYPALALSPTMPMDNIVSLFLFPHAWVRLAAARLASLVLSAQSSQDAVDLEAFTKANLPLLIEVARLSTLQLRSSSLEADLSLQIVKNLLFVGKCFATVSPIAAGVSRSQTNGHASEEEQNTVEDGVEGQNVDDDEQEEEEEQDDSTANIAANPLAWLFSRLSFQLRRAHADRRSTSSISASLSGSNWGQQPLAILRWFAAMASHLSSETLERFLPHILSPVYRIMEDDTTRDSEMDELKSLCSELQDLLQQKVGTTKFAEAYNRIRQKVGEVRRERRQARVVRETRDPEAAARERMRRNTMKERGRKRKAGMHMESKGKRGGKRRRFD